MIDRSRAQMFFFIIQCNAVFLRYINKAEYATSNIHDI